MKPTSIRIFIVLGIFAIMIPLAPPSWSAENQDSDRQAVIQTDSMSDSFSGEEFFGEDLYSTPTDSVADPFYYFNYAMYVVNDHFYFYVLKPVAKGYNTVLPLPARKGIRNFFHNLLFPIRFVNHLLQWKLEQASDEFGIFLVNSTAGILGFNQVAQKYLDMHTKKEDLGQTLGTYGLTEGFYLVLPGLGPTTFRDAVGMAGDYFILDPVNYVSPWELELGLDILEIVNRTSFHIGEYERVKEAAIDPYSAFKDAYIQHRRKQISQ